MPAGRHGGGDARPPRTAELRSLYRRRRAGVAAAFLSVLSVLGLGVAQAQSSGTGAVTTVVVRPGDTLWSIAHRLPHRGDVRPLVARLERARRDAVGPLQVGETIELR